MPSGHLVTPDPTLAGTASTAPLWMTDSPKEDAVDLWRRLVAVYPQTGLWPLMLEPLAADDGNRPWDDGELVPGDVAAVDALDPAKILADDWARVSSTVGDEAAAPLLEPYGNTFPGLAEAETSCERELADAVSGITGTLRLGLVAVRRPADAITRIGWLGPANYEDDISAYSAVLRSWEDRFGAYLVDVGFDSLILGVERPPRTTANRDHLAAEIAALDPDLVTQGAGSVTNLSSWINNSKLWNLWWD